MVPGSYSTQPANVPSWGHYKMRHWDANEANLLLTIINAVGVTSKDIWDYVTMGMPPLRYAKTLPVPRTTSVLPDAVVGTYLKIPQTLRRTLHALDQERFASQYASAPASSTPASAPASSTPASAPASSTPASVVAKRKRPQPPESQTPDQPQAVAPRKRIKASQNLFQTNVAEPTWIPASLEPLVPAESMQPATPTDDWSPIIIETTTLDHCGAIATIDGSLDWIDAM